MMYNKYNMDVDAESKWLIFTPNPDSEALPFRAAEAGHFRAGRDFYTERHSKPNYYVLYTISGQGFLNYNGTTMLLKPNEAVFFYCDNYHLYRTEGEEPWHHKWIHFDGASCSTFDSVININGVSPVFVKSPAFESYFDTILSSPIGNLDMVSSIKNSAAISNLLSELALSRYEIRAQSDSSPFDFVAAVHYIMDNCSRQMTITELAEHLHLSKFYFMRLFKEKTGVAPYEYLINFRIDKAKLLLRTTKLSVGKVAEEVGFLDESNFIRHFKRITGTTPHKYRKNEHYRII